MTEINSNRQVEMGVVATTKENEPKGWATATRGGGARKAKPPTTSCQLRAGVEHMFPKETDTRSLVLDNVGLSYVVLDGDEQAANRFYLEDLAIGLMRPPINIDIER